MNLDQLLHRRRSIRRYAPGVEITRSELETIVSAATEAPSWKNQQTSRYHIVTSPDTVAKLRDCLGAHNIEVTQNAAALIVTTFVKDIVGYNADGTPTNEIANGWGIYDLGLSNAVLLLKATDMGLDSIVLGIRDAERIRQLLAIPGEEVIVSVIALGRRTDDPARPKRKTVDEIAKFY